MAQRLANAFVKKGHSVSIFLEENLKTYELDNQINIYNGCNSKTTRNKAKRIGKNLHMLRKMIKSEQLDVLLIYMIGALPLGILSSFFTRCKVIVSERANPKIHERKATNAMEQFSKYCSGYIFQTERAKMCYSKKIQDKSVVIGNIAPKFNRTENKDNENVSICSAGSLTKDRGYETIFRAFKRLIMVEKDAVLTIYGEGSHRAALEEYAKKLNIEQSIHFEGFQANLMNHYQYHSIFIFACKNAGLPNVLLEAMATGLACISVDCEFGPRELIDDGKNGFLVPVDDDEKMFKRMLQLYKEPELRQSIGEEAIKVQERFSEDKIVESYLNYMKSV